MTKHLRAMRLVIAIAFEADRLKAALLCLMLPAQYIGPIVGAVAVKFLVDATLHHQGAMAVLAGGLAGLSVVISILSMELTLYLVHALEAKAEMAINRRLAELIIGLPGLEHYERPEYLDQIAMLRQQVGWTASGLNASLRVLAILAQAVTVCAILAAQHPLLLLLPLLGLPSLAASAVSHRLSDRALRATVTRDRLQHRLLELTAQTALGREARLFGLRQELLGRRRNLATSVNQELGRAEIAGALLHAAGWLIFSLGYSGAVFLVLREALAGGPTAGDVAMTVVLAGQAQGVLGSFVQGVGSATSVLRAALRLDWLHGYARRAHSAPCDLLAVPRGLTRGIDLRGVSFRYPGTDRPVLEDIQVQLSAGSIVALVGENGAGKTTLIKLLLGFYQPSAGRILVDGIDLRRFEPEAWRRRGTAVFQDYCRFEFLAREAIGLGDVRRIRESWIAMDAARRAAAAELIASLQAGLETQLGSSWEGGVDLSGGEWQKLALARALVPQQPLLLILDEPTASFDAEAETALLERFAAAASETAENGRITLLVSHHFTTACRADLILVLEQGRIREQGSHRELLRLGGLYAELYELQARAYQ